MLRLFVATFFVAALASAQTIVIEHARLIDGNGGTPIEDSTMIVEDGRITYVGSAADANIPDGVQRLNMRGKTIVPGIINMHGHVGSTKGLVQDAENFTRESVIANLRTYASYGVTTTTSMGTGGDGMIEYRNERERDEYQSARVLTALQGFTAIGGYPTKVPGVKGVAQEISTAQQAIDGVNTIADKGANLAKMWIDTHHGEYPKLAPELREAIINQANLRRLIPFAHVYELNDAKHLAKAGIQILGHSVRDADVDDELIGLLIGGNVTYVSTLMREYTTFIYGTGAPWINDPYFTRSVTASTVQGVKTQMKAAQAPAEVQRQGKQDLRMAMKNLKTLHDAGVRVGFGTDTGPPARFPGFFEHEEAAMMVDAGLTPMDVIVAWSKTNSMGLEIDGDYGTLEAGKVADFVILNRNPLDNIRNTRSIHRVYMGGRRFRW